MLSVQTFAGHDFRPDYKRLVELRDAGHFPDLPIMALTATATPKVRGDTEKQLKMSRTAWFIQSFNRPNLKFEVVPKTPASMHDMATTIKKQFAGQTGIIYCLSRYELFADFVLVTKYTHNSLF